MPRFTESKHPNTTRRTGGAGALSLAAHAPPGSGADAGGERNQVKLGRYETVREPGKGAMGIVYLPKDPPIGRLVALQTIRPPAHADVEHTRECPRRLGR